MIYAVVPTGDGDKSGVMHRKMEKLASHNIPVCFDEAPGIYMVAFNYSSIR